MPEIRTLLPGEETTLQRFLERCFGHGWDWFRRHQPDLYTDDPASREWGLVAVEDGQIVCHVGTFPMEIVSGPSRLRCGGIGNVATAPEARGKGYMSQLLQRSVEAMQEKRWPLSVLWGDPQRYGHFGYERAGFELQIDVNRRSLGGVAAAEVEEVDPASPGIAERILPLYETLPYRVDRPHFARRLMRPEIRLFIGEDGYVITSGDRGGNPTVIEVASPKGREAELILGVMRATFGHSATLIVEPGPTARIERLIKVASSWSVRSQGLFRIIDWPAFVSAIAPALEERAEGMPEFAVSVGARWQDTCDWATIVWDGSALQATEGKEAEHAVEVELSHLTRAVLGVPGLATPTLGPLAHLLPIQVHIPRLDHV